MGSNRPRRKKYEGYTVLLYSFIAFLSKRPFTILVKVSNLLFQLYYFNLAFSMNIFHLLTDLHYRIKQAVFCYCLFKTPTAYVNALCCDWLAFRAVCLATVFLDCWHYGIAQESLTHPEIVHDLDGFLVLHRDVHRYVMIETRTHRKLLWKRRPVVFPPLETRSKQENQLKKEIKRLLMHQEHDGVQKLETAQ